MQGRILKEFDMLNKHIKVRSWEFLLKQHDNPNSYRGGKYYIHMDKLWQFIDFVKEALQSNH